MKMIKTTINPAPITRLTFEEHQRYIADWQAGQWEVKEGQAAPRRPSMFELILLNQLLEKINQEESLRPKSCTCGGGCKNPHCSADD